MHLFIYCAGGLGREVYDIAQKMNSKIPTWKSVSFLDDDVHVIEDNIRKGKVNGEKQYTYEQFKKNFVPGESQVIIAHGEPRIRRILAEKLRKDNYTLANVIDPSARISPSARLGSGIIIFPNTYLSSCSVLGDNVLVSVGADIGHDSFIGDNSVVSTLVSVSGNCSIGSGCYVGTTACIKENIRIGENTIIGMGSCVFRDIGSGLIALGNPAREVRPNTNQKVFNT